MSYNKKIQLLDFRKAPLNKQHKRMVGILKRDKKCVTGKNTKENDKVYYYFRFAIFFYDNS